MSRFTPQFLDELRARTQLSTLVGRTVKLTRAGREHKACCPFHHEKSASFYVNDDKGFYHCFGCSQHGDAIGWLVDGRGLSFVDAVKELADAAGLALPAPDPQAAARDARAAGQHDVMAAAAEWYAAQLATHAGSEARDYLNRRGIAEATIADFALGFAPDRRDALKTALARFGDAALIEAGLLIEPKDFGDDKPPYDRFRGRLMIPIRDPRGRVIAFGGRIIGVGEPKYLNSPDTPLFDKGRTLYNLDKAAPAARKADRLIVVEGYLDVIALAQVGIVEAVAPLGTALTEAQLERLWRVVDVPMLCFDGDGAGKKAAIRAIERALPLMSADRSLRFIDLPHNEDPDDVVRRGGASAFTALLKLSESLADFIWRVQLEAVDLTSVEGRARLLRNLDAIGAKVADRTMGRELHRNLKGRFFDQFGFKKGAKRQNFERDEVAGVRAAMSGFRAKRNRSMDDCIARAVLLGLCRYTRVLTANVEAVAMFPIADPYLNNWRNLLISAAYENSTLDEDLINTILESSDVAPVEKRDLRHDLAFSFHRRDEQRAPGELLEVIELCIAEAEVSEALGRVNARFDDSTELDDYEEQQLLQREAHSLANKRAEWVNELQLAA